jgi:hypothetical protein
MMNPYSILFVKSKNNKKHTWILSWMIKYCKVDGKKICCSDVEKAEESGMA